MAKTDDNFTRAQQTDGTARLAGENDPPDMGDADDIRGIASDEDEDDDDDFDDDDEDGDDEAEEEEGL